jgi:hypothetical protein
MKLELWVGITQSGWSPVTWILMKWDPGGFEAKGRGLDQRYQSKCNPNPIYTLSISNPISHASWGAWITPLNCIPR